MHFQRPPHAEAKLVSCPVGRAFDVAVDLRRGSSTFLQWAAVEIDEATSFYIPRGMRARLPGADRRGPPDLPAQRLLAPEAEGGVRFDDPALGIDWPLPVGTVSDRDRAFPLIGDEFEGHRAVKCRHCGNGSFIPFADLQNCPPSNAMLTEASSTSRRPIIRWWWRSATSASWPRSTSTRAPKEIFDSDYTYFSSFSRSWLEHAERFAAMAAERFGLAPDSQVVEIASNDGYLLQYFHAARNSGARRRADREHRRSRDRPRAFRPSSNSSAGGWPSSGSAAPADLIVGNNVFAHVPDINDFSAGLKAALKPGGVDLARISRTCCG